MFYRYAFWSFFHPVPITMWKNQNTVAGRKVVGMGWSLLVQGRGLSSEGQRKDGRPQRKEECRQTVDQRKEADTNTHMYTTHSHFPNSLHTSLLAASHRDKLENRWQLPGERARPEGRKRSAVMSNNRGVGI